MTIKIYSAPLRSVANYDMIRCTVLKNLRSVLLSGRARVLSRSGKAILIVLTVFQLRRSSCSHVLCPCAYIEGSFYQVRVIERITADCVMETWECIHVHE